MTILDKIINDKKQELINEKDYKPISQLEKSKYFDRPLISLKNKLMLTPTPRVIAEFKRKSPSKGVINDKATPEEVAVGYTEAGAAAISVLTNQEYFGGSPEDLKRVREVSIETPILRKEFIVDEYQIVESKAIGADLILLIAAALTIEQTTQFSKLAKNLGLEVLLEVHNEKELEHVNEFVDIVGVNNRNLKTFEVNLDTSLALADKIGDDFVRISESGIGEITAVNTLFSAGFKGFLMGEHFMKQGNPVGACADFIKNLDTL